MSHFEEEAWFDFVRRLLPREEQALMQRHLDDGCARCSRIHKTWKTVVDIAGRESQYEPPASSTRLLKAAFHAHHRRPLRRESATIARPIYDSSLNPLPAGIRSGSLQSRQLVYAAGEHVIDLWLDAQGRRIALTGQALLEGKPSERFANVGVGLMHQDRMVAFATTNETGEFQLSFERDQDVELYIDIGGDAPIGVLLGRA